MADEMASVLVGIDHSDSARAACVMGGWLANRLDLELVLVRAGDSPRTPYGDHAEKTRMEHAAGRRAMATLNAVGPEVAKRRTACGRPAEVLQSIADTEEAALIVVGSHCRGGLRSTLARSVVRELMTQSECPLVVVPPSAFGRVLRLESDDARPDVVCGLEGSRSGDLAVTTAVQIAERAQLGLTFVHATTEPGSPAALPNAEPTVPIEPAATAPAVVASGAPADVLKRVAHERDSALIVVGSKKRSRFARAVLGSVSVSLITTAPCPVMVVPPGAARQPGV
jgi:nucleotide-binding universal stress UspA family protein